MKIEYQICDLCGTKTGEGCTFETMKVPYFVSQKATEYKQIDVCTRCKWELACQLTEKMDRARLKRAKQ